MINKYIIMVKRSLFLITMLLAFNISCQVGLSDQLMKYSEQGDIKKVKEILNQKLVDINAKDDEGNTALIYAAQNGHIDIVKELTKQGASVNVIDSQGWSGLIHAVENGYVDVVRELIEQGANVNIVDSYGYTPLMYAAVFGNIDMVEMLVKHGANIYLKNNNGETVFDLGDPNISQIINAIPRPNDNLLAASKSGNLSIVKDSIKNGANIESKDNCGNTPLILAVENNNINVVKELINIGSNIDVKNNYGETPLILASINGYKNIVIELLKNNAMLEAKTNHPGGETALFSALQNDRFAVFQELLKRGADPNATDSFLYTPLMYAAEYNNINAVKELLRYKADKNLKDIHGKSALDIAQLRKNELIVKLLS